MIVFAGAIDADLLRLRHEFLEMPGLVLTAAQTARLYSLSTAHAKIMLDTLEAEDFLVSASGLYRRATPATND